MKERPSRRNKDTMLKMLGQAISEVKDELSELQQTFADDEYSRYNLIREGTKEDLLTVMNYHISRGWVPLGGIAIETEHQSDDGKNFYLQAIWLPRVSGNDPLVLQEKDKISE